MKLNHINLGVSDVMATVDLLEKHFGLRPAGEGMPRNANMAFLHDDNDSLISVFKSKDVSYPAVFHVGFLQDSAKQVRSIHAQLKADGFSVPEPREQHGRITFYFTPPGGFVIEVEAFL